MSDATKISSTVRNVRELPLSESALDAINNFGSRTARVTVSQMMMEIPRTKQGEEILRPTYGELLNHAARAATEDKPTLCDAIDRAGTAHYTFLEKVLKGKKSDDLITDLRAELSKISGYNPAQSSRAV